jgi:hypothetical protein
MKSSLRRRHAPHVAGCLLAAAIALLPRPSPAQTPTPTPTLPAAAATSTSSFGSPASPAVAANSGTFGGDLLQPSLEGNPNVPQRFRRLGQATSDQPPPTDKFAPTRIGATPVYGSPNGFGAGDTGFDSLNTPRSKKKKKKPPPAPVAGALVPQPPQTTFTPVPTFNPAQPNTVPEQEKEPPPDIYPRKAANRPGAMLPPVPDELPLSNPPAEVHPLTAANRPGAVLPIPPPEFYSLPTGLPPPTAPLPNTLVPGTQPQRLLPIAAAAETDPYAALGIRAGSFVVLPSLDLTGGYVTNAERVPSGQGSVYFIAAPEVQVRSDWERHSLTADVAASYTAYAEPLVPSLDVPYLNSKIDGRIDVSRDIQLLLEGRALVNTDNPGSPNLQAQLARLPINTDIGATLGLAEQFGRVSFSVKGAVDSAQYQASQLTNGTSVSNIDRDFNQYAGLFHVGYEIDPGMIPFLEVQIDTREHPDEPERNSNGAAAKLGTAVNLFGSLTGNMAIGYLDRAYTGPGYPNINGPFADGALIWQATGLTTAKLSATAQVYETTLVGASGEFSRDFTLEVDHAFRTWLIGVAKVGYGTDDYVGGNLFDDRWYVSAGIIYKFTREVQISAQLREDWLNSSNPTNTYSATSFLLGLHLQR